jgi:hypothetical protein
MAARSLSASYEASSGIWTPRLRQADGSRPLPSCASLRSRSGGPAAAKPACREVYKKFRPRRDDHLLFLYTDAIGNLHTKKPVRSIDDLKGMQVRGTGNDVPLIKAMGGTPVGTPWSEVYLALQRGVAEGLISNHASYKAAKLAEVTKFTTDLNVRSVGFWVAMNKKKWESLGPDVQKVVNDVSEDAVGWLGHPRLERTTPQYILSQQPDPVPTKPEAAPTMLHDARMGGR